MPVFFTHQSIFSTIPLEEVKKKLNLALYIVYIDLA